jgi:hypothetical protein
MEGFSIITYKDKTIFYSNFSIFQSDPDQKQKILKLMKYGEDEWLKQPLNSVLALINVLNLNFDMEILRYFRESLAKTTHYEKKIAIIGVTGLIKTAYNFVIGLVPNQKVKTFDTEEEAMEWLVKED